MNSTIDINSPSFTSKGPMNINTKIKVTMDSMSWSLFL